MIMRHGFSFSSRVSRGDQLRPTLTREVFDDDLVGRLVDVRVERRVGLALEPGHLLPDHLVSPAQSDRELADTGGGAARVSAEE